MTPQATRPALLPAATFPPFRWFELAQRPASMVCAHEHYVKQSLRNRVLLVSGQGPVAITLPVHRRHAQSRSVADIVFTDRIAPGVLLKGLQTHCGRTPYFDHYFPEIEAWAHAHLLPGNAWLDAAIASTQWACEAMGFAHPARSNAYIDGTLHDDWRPKSRWQHVDTVRYPQVFEDRLGFVQGRSILDVLFHLGPEAAFLTSRHGNDDLA